MPELPEVETVCRGLLRALQGAKVLHVGQYRKDLRLPMPPRLATRLVGKTIRNVRRRAKYILIDLDQDEVLLFHLGMSGRIIVRSTKSSEKQERPGKHDHLILRFDNGCEVRFNDPRRFGVCDLVACEALDRHPLLTHLGLEPLGPKMRADILVELFAGKKAAIKDVLMDQRLVVGIGNIYASESLFWAGIKPIRSAGSCTKQELARLIKAVQKVLKAAIRAGGSSLRDYRQADGELGYFQHHFAVYDREGEFCPGCNCEKKRTSGIQRIVQGGRSTYYCPFKQV